MQPKNLEKVDWEDMCKKMIWETRMKSYIKRIDLLESNTRVICAIVWGQSSPTMQSKLESLKGFDSKSNSCDCTWLLREIQDTTHCFEGAKNIFILLDDAWRGYYGYRQGPHQNLHDYMKNYQDLV